MRNKRYILITAARNEEKFIRETIKSVIDQTILPLKWYIVSDNSTDKTDQIVEEYSSRYPYLELIKKRGDRKRNFGSKARAVMYAYENAEIKDFDYIGNLDADVAFRKEYYSNIINEFENDNSLGLAGGIRYDLCNKKFVEVPHSLNSVGGPFQMFRKKCFEDIAGYSPLKYGGIDAVAEIKARMLGWKVKSFPEYKLYHLRCTGSATRSNLKFRIRQGLKFYSIGYDPLFITLKMLKDMITKTFDPGNLISIAAYFWATIFNFEKQVSKDITDYLKMEQRERMLAFIKLKKLQSNKSK